jgi:hypothetical protein
MGLSQVLLNFESFCSDSITFFQVQEFLNSIFELGPVENIKQAKGNEFISFGLFNIFQFLSFLKSQLFYIHILTLFAKIFFHSSYSDSRPNKTFSPCCSSCVGANKMLRSGSQETDPEPWGFTLQTGYPCKTGLHQKGQHINLIHHLCKVLCEIKISVFCNILH